MDEQNVTALAALDLSAAFVSVDHQVLVHVLNKKFGICGHALDWLETYLRPRTFQVQIGTSLSTKKDLPFSVPQGSCAGPVLYNTYVSTLQYDIRQFSIQLLGYADDQLTYKAFKAGNEVTKKCAIEDIERCLIEVNKWMSQNRLKMNPDKTEFVVFGGKQQLKKCDEIKHLQCVDKDVNRSGCIKFLGAWLDEELSMCKHISEVTRKCNLTLYNILQIRKYLTKEALTQITLSLVTSKLDYVNSLFIGLPAKTLKPLKSTQHFAAKVLTYRTKYDSNTAALKELHWPPVEFRIQFKILCYVFKCLKNDAPDYLCSLFETKRSNRLTRSSLRNDLVIPNVRCKSFGGRSFAVQGATLWNTLPQHTRDCDNYDGFKKNENCVILQSFYLTHVRTFSMCLILLYYYIYMIYICFIMNDNVKRR